MRRLIAASEIALATRIEVGVLAAAISGAPPPLETAAALLRCRIARTASRVKPLASCGDIAHYGL